MSDRPVPRLGAIAIVIHADHVLLVQRRNPPDAGLWGFPGGHVEWGETALVAAAREVHEETGVAARPLDYLTNIDLIRPARGGEPGLHYLLAAVLCQYEAGTPVPADDALAAAWVPCRDVRAGALAMSDRVETLMDLALDRQARRAERDDRTP